MDTEGDEESEEVVFKLLVVGDYATGKTSLIRRFCEGTFSPNYKLTIGVDFSIKTLQIAGDTRITLQIWDIAGHEKFGYLTHVYYKYASGALIVFDLSRNTTYDTLLKWLTDIRQKVFLPNDEVVPIVILANKVDLVVDEEIPFSANLDRLVQENNLVGWFPTSAKDNLNVEDAFSAISNRVYEKGMAASVQQQQGIEGVDLSMPPSRGNASAGKKNNKSCCF